VNAPDAIAVDVHPDELAEIAPDVVDVTRPSARSSTGLTGSS
jgi:hypothetical protein